MNWYLLSMGQGGDDGSWVNISDEIEWMFVDPNQQQNFMMDTLNNVTCCTQQLSNNISDDNIPQNTNMDFSTLTRNEPGLTSGELNMDYTGFSDGVPPATESEGSVVGPDVPVHNLDSIWPAPLIATTDDNLIDTNIPHPRLPVRVSTHRSRPYSWWRPCQIPRKRPKQNKW